MKFFTLFIALATAAYAQYCPITSGSCNTSNVPSKPKTAELKRQYLVDGYSCAGTVTIVDECHFNIKGFSVVAPGSKKLNWYGAEVLNSSSGGNLLTNEEVVQSPGAVDVSFATGDHNPFCRASLVDHVGAISLIDEDWKVICYAVFDNSGSSSSGSKTSTNTNTNTNTNTVSNTSNNANSNSVKPGNATVTTANTNQNAGKATSDASSRYVISSVAVVLAMSLLLL